MPGMDGFISFNGTMNGSVAGGSGGNVNDVKVRDSQETTFKSVVNEEGVAEIDLISYVRRNELTQAIENVENSIDNVEQLVDTKQNIINYSTEEQSTCQKWIDGKDIYQIVFILANQITVSATTWTNTDLTLLNVDKFINGFAISEDGTFQGSVVVDKSNNVIQLQSTRNSNAYVKYLTVQYTKTTD